MPQRIFEYSIDQLDEICKKSGVKNKKVIVTMAVWVPDSEKRDILYPKLD
jgi:hypothetical protein